MRETWNLKIPLLIAVLIAIGGFFSVPIAAAEEEPDEVVLDLEADPVPAEMAGDTNPPFHRTQPIVGDGFGPNDFGTIGRDDQVAQGGVAASRGDAIRPG